jgi:flavodoxin I
MIIIYGSSTGNCEEAANQIATYFGDVLVKEVSTATADDLQKNNKILLGSSTWGDGEMQDDFDPFLSVLKKTDFSGKKIALFGTGDADGYGDTFVDALKILYDIVVEKGGEVLGQVEANEYDYEDSQAVIDGKFVGLPLDYDNEPDKVDDQIKKWVENLKSVF